MLTYPMEERGSLPLYEYLCRSIRSDILSGALPAGTRLPSKRALAEHLRVSVITVEGAYSQLEDQEISGANITSAMERIEGMMDKVVEGFEKQLDQLFQGDAMDITTDVEVLERMLAKDGLSDTQGMTLNL